jgi:hypothetical protein
MNIERIDGIRFDTESITEFVNLLEKDEWSEEDLDRFVLTEGIQYLIEQEKESGPNFDENAIKTYLKRVKQGYSGEHGGWETAWNEKTRIQKRLDYIFSRQNYLVVRPFEVVRDYLPERIDGEGTCYFLPGGSRESYSDSNGFAINLGHGTKSDLHWIFLMAREAYHFWFAREAGDDPRITKCETPSEFIETFLDLTHREGMATLVGLRAARTEEQFFKENPLDEEKRSKYADVFQMALEGKVELDDLLYREIFFGHTSPSALFGATIAKTIEECGKELGRGLGRDMLLGTVTGRGFFILFELYKGYDKDPSLLPHPVWDAFERVRKEKELRSAREDPFLLG